MFRRVKILIFILLSAICYLPSSPLMAANVKIVGRQMLVDGKPFTVKGVNYGYTPVGSGYSTYDWTIHPEFYKADFALIRAMGANTVRFHSMPTDTKLLDAAYEYGLFVIITCTVDWNKDFNVQANRDKVLSDLTTTVNKWKDHPAILMWLIGNEINFHTTSLTAWYSLLNDCAVKVHELEGMNHHPVTSAEANIDMLGSVVNRSDDAHVPDVDVWAAQVYRGATTGFDSMFEEYAAKSTKPLILTEFGCDAYNTATNAEDENSQAETIKNELNIIETHLSALNAAEECVGGCIFQWADDWSKNQWGAVNSTHDTVGTWNNDAYYDFESTAKNNMNEEWWGLCSISAGTDAKTLRKAYTEVQAKWAPSTQSTASSSNVFSTDITNYPNPFNPVSGSTTIVFTVAPGTGIKVKIYDIAGRLVKTLKEETVDTYAQYKITWDGKDEENKTVANGVYICFVEGNGTTGTEVKYRKILALK
ncbi:MAG: glycoside hydrolase family 2 TIM barrel-domain containing protein [bacterium]|nr:glycoside hydrolase family 2 TIM barrel-domain containing protein [bacterium]